MITINAEIRKTLGKASSRRLRIANKIPAIIYSRGHESISIELHQNDIITKNKEDFYKNPLYLVINGKKIIVHIQAVQYHSFKSKLTHIDFIHTQISNKKQ